MKPWLARSPRGRRGRVERGAVPDPLQPVRVHSIRAVTPRAVAVRLESAIDGVPLVPFEPGSHVDVHLRDDIVRQYSLVGSGKNPSRYEICVQRAAGSRGGSARVHEALRAGDRLAVSLPRNTFALREVAGPSLLLAGGIGITPFVSMAGRLHETGADFRLHAYVRDGADLPCRQELTTSAWSDRIIVHESARGDSFRQGGPSEVLTPSRSGAVYVCGPDGFAAAALARARAAGWDEAQVITEAFAAPARDPGALGREFVVVAASTGQRMLVPSDRSIADVVEHHGYDSRRSCGQGYCGSCLTRILAGTPDHRDTVQTPAQHASDSWINLCCSRARTPELVLDI